MLGWTPVRNVWTRQTWQTHRWGMLGSSWLEPACSRRKRHIVRKTCYMCTRLPCHLHIELWRADKRGQLKSELLPELLPELQLISEGPTLQLANPKYETVCYYGYSAMRPCYASTTPPSGNGFKKRVLHWGRFVDKKCVALPENVPEKEPRRQCHTTPVEARKFTSAESATLRL